MASIILGGIGAAVGSAIGGPAAAWKGFQIGSAVGGVIDAINSAPRIESGKLDDRRHTGSSYGAPIPSLWGEGIVGGNIVWVAKDADGNHLVETRNTRSAGGKGGGSVTEYKYTASFAVQLCVGERVFPDGTTVDRNVALRRVKADDVVVWDASQSGLLLSRPENLRFRRGTLVQMPDALMIAKEGVRAWNGRGYASVVIQDMALQDFGNRIPTMWTFEMATDPVSVADVVGDILRSAKFSPDELDLVAGASVPVRGFVETNVASPIDSLRAILFAYDFDLPEVDGKLRLVRRGGPPSFTIEADELGATVGETANSEPGVTTRRPQLAELPGKVSVTHLDPATHFETATQYDSRPDAPHGSVLSIVLPLALTPDEAKKIAQRECDRRWIEGQGKHSGKTTLRHLAIAPCDTGWIRTDLGLRMVRMDSVSIAPIGPITLVALPDRVKAGDVPGGGDSGTGETAPPAVPVPTVFRIWSGPALIDAHRGTPGVYVAASGGAGWRGGTIYASYDGGANWTRVGVTGRRSTFGVTTSVLADGTVPNAYDGSTVGVDLAIAPGTLLTRTAAEVETGLNQAMVGEEVLGFRTATLIGPNAYTLSNLRRGERGSPMTGHAIGEPFTILDDSIVRFAVPVSTVGTSVLVKVVSVGLTLADVAQQSVTVEPATASPLDLLAAKVAIPTYVTAAVLAEGTPNAGGIAPDAAWTTLNLASLVPEGTSEITLSVTAQLRPTAAGSGTEEQIVGFRAASGSPEILALDDALVSAGTEPETKVSAQVRVPIDATNRRIDYRVDGTMRRWKIALQAYWSPVDST